ncbi:MAG: hypothetical protein HY744_29185 [Deltaproteobacteria bacterium]|nr:hypothetical protein [Deltaproteobacteria bacterium]
MKIPPTVAAALLALALGACRSGPTEQEPPRATGTPGAATAAHAHGAPPPGAPPHEGCEPPPPGVDATVREGKDPATGAPMQVVGAPLAGVPLVTVADLVARPEELAGRSVRLEGRVSAMCQHARAWFAVQNEGASEGAFVRVLTTPRFLVPPGAIGKRARAEGTVELVEVSAEAAKHFAGEHQLGEPGKAEGPAKRAIVRATGAEFL